MGFSITVTLPNCGSKFLPNRSFRDKGAFSLAICLEFYSLCHFLHPAQPLLVRHQRRMSWTTIRSLVGGGRFDPPSGSSSKKSSRRPRLIKAIQDLRTKLLVKIQEIKKDLPMKLLFLLVGFYSATAFSTFIGQTGDWDVLSAALAVIVVECIGALMYRASIPLINKMRSIIAMFNYWKTGLALGLFLDSFKYEVLVQTLEATTQGNLAQEWTLASKIWQAVSHLCLKPIHEGCGPCGDLNVVDDKTQVSTFQIANYKTWDQTFLST